MTPSRRFVRVASASVLLLAAAASARAGGIDLTSVQVKGKGVVDGTSVVTVTVRGILSSPGPLDDADPVFFQLGTVKDSRRGSAFVPKGPASLVGTFLPADGSKIVVKVSIATGAFSVKATKIVVGPLDARVPFTLRFGDRAMTVLMDLTPVGKKAAYKAGQPLRARITGRVIGAGSSRGRHTLAAVVSAPLTVKDDTEEPAARVTLEEPPGSTNSSGWFDGGLSFTEPGDTDTLNLGAVVGSAGGSTEAGTAKVVVGEDGNLRAVAFVQRVPGGGATVTAAGGVLSSDKSSGKKSGTLTFAAGAVTSTISGVYFSPYTLPASLPAPMESPFLATAGVVPVAGADLRGPYTTFADGKVTLELERPGWVRKSALEGKTIDLYQFTGAAWEKSPTGRGLYDSKTDRIVPDPASPAYLRRMKPVVYAITRTDSGKGHIKGRVRRNRSSAVEAAAVFTAAGATVTGADGEFEVPQSAVDPAELQALQVVDADLNVAQVLDPGAGSSDLTVDISEAPDDAKSLTTIAGTVYRSDGSTPVVGATVTVRLSPSVIGLDYDDGGTTSEASDDAFSVSDLSAVGVESVQWCLFVPGAAEFVSTLHAGRSVRPYDLILELQEARGSLPPQGAYNIRARVVIPVVGNAETWGGFRLTYTGGVPEIGEIVLPLPFEGVQAATGLTNNSGIFSISYLAPAGVPLEIDAVAPDGAATAPLTFLESNQASLQNMLVGASGSLPAGFQFLNGKPVSSVDAAEMVIVPEGEFTRGDSLGGTADPAHPVFLPGFLVDRAEVTVAQFQAFVTASQGAFAMPAQPGGSTSSHPVVNVTWAEAMGYAAWAGKRLPTEAEWERAARGTDGRLFPWGSADDAAKRNQNGTGLLAASSAASVGTDGASPVGCINMAGNAAEWCSDWYDAEVYQATTFYDPSGPITGSSRVQRGGAWNGSAADLQTTSRRYADPGQRSPAVGFRCAAPLR